MAAAVPPPASARLRAGGPDRNRRRSSPAPLAVMGLALGACGGAPGPEEAGPFPDANVILVSLDTCRADSMGFLGAPRATPALDRLGAEGVVFEDCFAQSSATAPSHLSILTGMGVQRHGLLKNGERSTPAFTLASLLRDRGYRTAAFTGHGSFQAKFGHGVGFETFVSWHDDDESRAVEGLAPFQRTIAEAAGEALAWLDALGPDERFFLVVHGYDPHMPFWPPEPRRTAYAGWYGGPLDIEQIYKREQFDPLIEAGGFGPEEQRYVRDLYDAEVAAADESIGAFLDGLRERGLFDEALLVYLSDHGELLGEHDKVGHGFFYRQVTEVPLVLRFPGGRWAGRVTTPVQHVDVAPTVLRSLGLPVPAGMQGASLLPLVRGEEFAEGDDRMLVALRKHNFALRFTDHPGLHILGRRRAADGALRDLEVYDLAADPHQQRNLVQRPEHQELLRELLSRFVGWSATTAREDGRYREADTVEVQDEDLEMLRALGYLGDDELPSDE